MAFANFSKFLLFVHVIRFFDLSCRTPSRTPIVPNWSRCGFGLEERRQPFDRLAGSVRADAGAVCGIAVFEGWAKDLKQAELAAAGGEFAFHPNDHFGAVVPMTGVTTISQPVVIVENKTFGNRAYCTINEGLGKVMRFGGNDDDVLDRQRLFADVIGPALSSALKASGGIPLKNIIARSLAMGDEMHQRNVACSMLFLRDIALFLAQTATEMKRLAEVLRSIGKKDQFFLNIAMAMARH